MIRNYYTDSYKSAIAVTPSDTLLIDGRTKATTPIGSWKQYNLYIGNSPTTLPVTTTANNNAVSNSVNVGLKSPNPQIKVGMRVTGAGLPDAGLLVATVVDASNYTLSQADTIAEDATLTYSYDAEASIKVHTINNEVITFKKPAQGFVLPVSVVQVYATDTTGGVTDIVALS